MDYLIRFSQSHETFRLPEMQALALIEGIDMKVIAYSLEVSRYAIYLNPCLSLLYISSFWSLFSLFSFFTQVQKAEC